MWGFSSKPAGEKVAERLAALFARLQPAQREALSAALVRIVPTLSREAGQVALPMDQLVPELLRAAKDVWTDLLTHPLRTLEETATAIQTSPACAELRAYCATVAGTCQVDKANGS